MLADPVTVSIDDIAVPEGDSGTTDATFTVSSPVAPYVDATIDATTADDTATAPDDYTATGPTTLTLGAGSFSTTFDVPVVGDTVAEPDEDFLVDLTAPVDTLVADPQGVGTILDDGDVCGAVIIGVFRLTADLTCPGRGLIVGGPDTVIDLNGHTITGSGGAVGIGGLPGADISGSVVRDGTLRGFDFGVRLVGADVVVRGVTTRGGTHGIVLIGPGVRVVDATATGAARNGIRVRSSTMASVRESAGSANGRGIVARAPRTAIFDNVARDNTILGIYARPVGGVRGARNTAVGNPEPQCSPPSLC